jgi:hypothetical protein
MGTAMRPSAKVSITFRPTVHPPKKAKPVMRTAAEVLLMNPAPTDGPQATPAEDPPMLKPTNRAPKMPMSKRIEIMINAVYCAHTIRPPVSGIGGGIDAPSSRPLRSLLAAILRRWTGLVL